MVNEIIVYYDARSKKRQIALLLFWLPIRDLCFFLFFMIFLNFVRLIANSCTYHTLNIVSIILNKLRLAVHVECVVKAKNTYRILVLRRTL